MAFYEKAVALDIGTTSIKGVSYKFSLGELQILDCRYVYFDNIDIPEHIWDRIRAAEERRAELERVHIEDEDDEPDVPQAAAKKSAKKEAVGAAAGGGGAAAGTVTASDLDETDLVEPEPELDMDGEGELHHEEEITLLSYIVERFVGDNWGTDASFIINLPSDSIIIRDVQVPFHDPKRVLEVLPFELENMITIPIDESVIETSLWGRNEEGGATSLTMVVPNARINERTEIFINKHMVLKNVAADPIALSRLVTEIPEAPEQSFCAQIDIGGDVTLLNIIRDGELAFSRILNFGGRDYTGIIAEQLKVSEKKAEEIKLKLGLHIDDPAANDNSVIYKQYKISKAALKKIVAACLELTEDLIQELDLSLSAAGAGGKISYVYLSGGGSRLGGLSAIISRELGTVDHPVTTGGYEFVPNFPEPTGIDVFAACVGQIYHHVFTKKRPLNFLKGNIRKLLKGQQDWAVLKWPAVFLGASLLMSIFSFYMNLSSLDLQIEQANKQLVDIYEKGFKKKYKEEQGPVPLLIQKAMKGIEGMLGPVDLGEQNKILNVMKSVSEAMPDNTVEFSFLRMQFKQGQIQIVGMIPDFATVTKVKDKLEASKKFSKVDVKNKTSTKKGVRATFALQLGPGKGAN